MNIPDTPFQYAPSFKALARLFSFDDYVDAYLVCNSSAGSGFHNFLQAKWIVEDTYLYYMSQVDESKDPLDKEDLRLTLIAALFKDVNHGCGSCSDRSNVTRAVLTLQEASALVRRPLSNKENRVVSAAITSTWFELNSEAPAFAQLPLTPGERALRDADQSMAFRFDSPHGKLQFEGFLDEVNMAAELSGRPKMSIGELYEHTRAFLTRTTFWTPLGNTIRDRHLQRCLTDMQNYIQASPENRQARLKSNLTITHHGIVRSLIEHLAHWR